MYCEVVGSHGRAFDWRNSPLVFFYHVMHTTHQLQMHPNSQCNRITFAVWKIYPTYRGSQSQILGLFFLVNSSRNIVVCYTKSNLTHVLCQRQEPPSQHSIPFCPTAFSLISSLPVSTPQISVDQPPSVVDGTASSGTSATSRPRVHHRHSSGRRSSSGQLASMSIEESGLQRARFSQKIRLHLRSRMNPRHAGVAWLFEWGGGEA